MNKYFSITQAAEILGVHPNTLRRWDRIGLLHSVRFGDRGDRKYSEEEISKVLSIGKNRFKGPRMQDQPNIGVGIAVFNEKGQVLLGKRERSAAYGADEYCFPGGRIAFGESPVVTARRELNQKCGLDVAPQPCCLVYSTKYLEAGYHSFSVGFYVKVNEYQKDKIKKGWDFYNINALPQPFFDVNKQILDAILGNQAFNF